GVDIGKLEHDERGVELPLERMDPPPMHQEAAPMRFERGIDPPEVLRNLVVEVDVAQLRHRVGFHDELLHWKGLAVANHMAMPVAMMNAPSVTPTPRKNSVCSRGISSGWRADASRNLEVA